MDTLTSYSTFVQKKSSDGSNLAGSYVRALRYATRMLRATMPEYAHMAAIWEIDSLKELEEIYRRVKSEERKKGDSVFAAADVPKSYWLHRYCSNAIRTFAQFLTESKQARDAVAVYNAESDPAAVAKAIGKWSFNPVFYLDDDVGASSKEGRDVIREVKARQNQDVFRRIVLLNYGFSCCITGLPVREVLQASHIIGWEENVKTRLLPTNGLCLAATYHAAFDRHLISFDENYRMILASSLKEYCTNRTFCDVFKAYEGRRLLPAVKFQPAQEFLAVHRERLNRIDRAPGKSDKQTSFDSLVSPSPNDLAVNFAAPS